MIELGSVPRVELRSDNRTLVVLRGCLLALRQILRFLGFHFERRRYANASNPKYSITAIVMYIRVLGERL